MLGAVCRGLSKRAWVAVLVLGACSGNGSDPKGAGGTVGSGGVVSSGGALSSGGTMVSSSGGTIGTGGTSSSTGGTSGTGGTSSSTGGTTGTGGTVSSSGGTTATGGVSSPVGGTTGAGGHAVSSGGGGGGRDGAVGSGGSLGTGGSTTGGADAGTGGASGCTRESLKATIDAYFEALAAHSAASLPLADNVKFTENGKVLTIGQDGLWKTAGPLKYAHSALDPEGCNAASEAVVPDGGKDIPYALRLKLQNGKLTQVETIAARAGDYSVASNTSAIIASASSVKWEEPVPAAERNTREEMTAWMDKYFRIFPNGVCNTVSTCKRLENGGGNYACSAGGSCTAGPPGSGKPAIPSHIIFADVETGIGVGFALFLGSNADMHMFKMVGGQVHAVHTVLAAATSTGWE